MYQELKVDQYRSQAPSALYGHGAAPGSRRDDLPAYAWPWLGSAPRGDGHPVLVLPGFTAGDGSNVLLRRYLERVGYAALPWKLGRNTGSFEIQERLIVQFRKLTEAYDARISLVGQSLGGVYARELARQFSDRVRLVVSLGSPLSSTGPESTNAVVSRWFQYLSGMRQDQMRERILCWQPA